MQGVEDPRRQGRRRAECPSFRGAWSVARDGGVAEVGRGVPRWWLSEVWIGSVARKGQGGKKRCTQACRICVRVV